MSIAGTELGKSLSFQVLPFIIKGGIIFVLMTTLALMEDQV